MNGNNRLPALILPGVVPWIDAARLRTLPLALASIMTGAFLAIAQGSYTLHTILFALLTGILLQILSNLANDYGDAVKGTDNEHRAGPTRTVQSGRISAHAMKTGIIVAAVMCLLSGCALLYESLGAWLPITLAFLVFGVAAIASAIRYTMGANAYGYRGLGDPVVFLFFGLAGVAGTWFLNTREWQWDILLPAASIGFLSTAVLNLNNMRDMDNDRLAGKRTLASRLGYGGARLYHTLLVASAFAAAVLFTAYRAHSPWGYLFLLALPLFARDAVAILKTNERRALDPYLKKLSLSSLLFSLLFGAGLLI